MAQASLESLELTDAMEGLEHLLTGPVDQMVLPNAPKPVAPGKPMAQGIQANALWGEMIRAEEMMTAYPEQFPSFIHSLDNFRPPLLKQTTASVATSGTADTSRLEDTIQEVLKITAAKVLNVKSEEIESNTALLEYGFDLVTLTELTNQLNQTYHLQLEPTLFLETPPTLQQLTHYLVQRHQDALQKYFSLVLDTDKTVKTHA